MVAPKKRKDSMPKKHDPKKGGVTMSKKKRQGMIRERKPLPQGVIDIHPVTSQVFNLAKHRLATNVMHKESRKI
jgi:hypothetical protein